MYPMSEMDLENTQPSRPRESLEDTQPNRTPVPPESPASPQEEGMPQHEPETQPHRRSLRGWVIAGGILLILLLGGLGTYLGYHAAQVARSQMSREQIVTLATEQMMLAQQDLEQGRFQNARRRLEYVIQLDPNFPGVQEKLAEVMIQEAFSLTPTATIALATSTPTPTPDFRGEEEIFNNARQLLAQKEWFAVLDMLDALRNKNLTYRAVEVDGMYYIALRNRGLAKINNGNLEGGLYDLALVERFGPLDVDAQGVRNWARLYLTGAAYWGVRWDQVIFYFSQIVPAYPGLRDVNGVTALERYRMALIKYGDQLATEGKYCEALKQYEAAQQVAPDGMLEPTMTAVYNLCYVQPTETPTLPFTLTPTPSTTGVILPPTETPTPPAPTETPTATPAP